MANVTFTELPSTGASQLTDIIAADQGATTVKQTLSQVIELSRNNTILNFAGNPNGNLAGELYQLCWDTSNNLAYICTAAGDASSAVWTLFGSVTVPISMDQGGSGAALVPSNGGMVYSTASTMGVLGGTATANQALLSGSSSAPSWSTATYLATTNQNSILFSTANNVIGEITPANSGVLVSDSSGVPTFTSSLTDGQVVVGSTGGTPAAATISAGDNIGITAGSASLEFEAIGGGACHMVEVTTATQAMEPNTIYTVSYGGGMCTMTLPVNIPYGSHIGVVGSSSGGWRVNQNASQQMFVQSSGTTVGASGFIASQNRWDSVHFVCTVADLQLNTYGRQSLTLTIA